MYMHGGGMRIAFNLMSGNCMVASGVLMMGACGPCNFLSFLYSALNIEYQKIPQQIYIYIYYILTRFLF